ncbi:unnamed protein product, partial [Prorocentrum cordatum]
AASRWSDEDGAAGRPSEAGAPAARPRGVLAAAADLDGRRRARGVREAGRAGRWAPARGAHGRRRQPERGVAPGAGADARGSGLSGGAQRRGVRRGAAVAARPL